MVTCELIFNETKKIADENRGSPPGRKKFEQCTGTCQSEWRGLVWTLWGDACLVAGFEPNQKQDKRSHDFILRKYAEAARHFGKISTDTEIRMFSRGKQDFPGHSTFFNRFAGKDGLTAVFAKWVG